MTIYNQIIRNKLPDTTASRQLAEGEVQKQKDQWKEWSEQFWTKIFLQKLSDTANEKFIELSRFLDSGILQESDLRAKMSELATIHKVIKLAQTGEYGI